MNNANQPVGGGDPRLVPIGVSSREDVTTQQVQTVLAVVQNMNHLLARGRMPWEDEDVKLPARFDGGTVAAAQATLILACDRLDSILKDESRWSLGKENQLHEAIVKMHAAQTALAEENRQLLARHNKPSVIFRPQFAMVEGGGMGAHFIAYIGDIDRQGCAIIGRGATPADALQDFDDAFYRTPDKQVQMVLNIHKKQNPPNDPTL